MSRTQRKKHLTHNARRRRQIGAFFASIVFQGKGSAMVATRDDVRAKALLRGRKYRPTARQAPAPLVPRQTQPAAYVTHVNGYMVTTSATGQTLAATEDGAPIEFRGPYGLSIAQLHTFACRFLERRGPNYAPGKRLVVTLDGHGRKRESVEV